VSNEEISLELQERKVLRKGLAKLRSEGMVPGVIHDHGKPSIHVMSDYQTLAKAYLEAGKHHTIELSVGSRKDTAIIKDVHFNPVKHSIEHVVFQAVRSDEPIETEVPIIIEGEIPAEKVGLMLINHLTHVDVEALPKNLPNEVKVDGSKLTEIGDKITVADIIVQSGVTILTEPEATIASIEETKAQISEESEEATAEEAAETEKTEASEEE
jgi:large subunit ribosomal protein L25